MISPAITVGRLKACNDAVGLVQCFSPNVVESPQGPFLPYLQNCVIIDDACGLEIVVEIKELLRDDIAGYSED